MDIFWLLIIILFVLAVLGVPALGVWPHHPDRAGHLGASRSALEFVMTQNRRAFLSMIAYSEIGDGLLSQSDNGYNVICGSTVAHPILFDSYADHPRKLMSMTIHGKIVRSTGAGRYQILARYYDHYKAQLGLPDFSPASQDAIALQLIRECHALEDIDAGRFLAAVAKCRSRWASFPGAGYGQYENDAGDLQVAFLAAGGTLAIA